MHLDVKHLPKLRTADGEWRKRYLFVAIDRRSRSVHLAVKDDETEASARAFLEEALAAFPFRVTHLLTDRGSCFTAEGFEKLCRELGIEHRKTRPYTPRTNGMAERFNGRVQREVLGITVAGHRDLERLLAGFNSGLQRPPPARPGRALARGGRPRAAWRRTGASPTPATAHRPIRASCPRPCWSSSAPRTSRSQTTRPFPVATTEGDARNWRQQPRATRTMHAYANPLRFQRIADAVYPWTAWGTAILAPVALVLALAIAPADYQQGEAYRIMYRPCPGGWMAMFGYLCVAVGSAVGLIWRHPLAEVAARAAAPIGAVFTAIALPPARSGASRCGAPGGSGTRG